MVKRFGALLANDVDHFAVGAGEIVALLGENGAGKSTLCKILYGYYRPDAGEFRMSGERVSNDRLAARRPPSGHRHGVPEFQPDPGAERLGECRAVSRRCALGDRSGATAPPHGASPSACAWRSISAAPVGRLAVGDQQKVEILKQLLAGARVLILDEPTKVLAPQEAEGLFRTLAELRAEGYGVVFITHKLREVMACADRIVVMRQGRIVGAVPAREAARRRCWA